MLDISGYISSLSGMHSIYLSLITNLLAEEFIEIFYELFRYLLYLLDKKVFEWSLRWYFSVRYVVVVKKKRDTTARRCVFRSNFCIWEQKSILKLPRNEYLWIQIWTYESSSSSSSSSAVKKLEEHR